jgi:putative membrane protein
MNKYLLFLLFLLIGVFGWSAIKPADYLTWILEVGPGAITIIFIGYLYYKKLRFTWLTYAIITLLVIWTFIGGHFTYDNVPWFTDMKEAFGWERNPYDRFGHFLKGLMVIIFREVLLIKTRLNKGVWLQLLSLSLVMTVAASYEIIEFVVAKILGRSAEDFQGMQGDLWDSQWDMSLALAGSLLTIICLTRLHNKILERINP